MFKYICIYYTLPKCKVYAASIKKVSKDENESGVLALPQRGCQCSNYSAVDQ